MSQQQKIRKIAYMGMYLALYFVLDWLTHTVPLFKMPQGGSLGLSVLALLLASYHLGWKQICQVPLPLTTRAMPSPVKLSE